MTDRYDSVPYASYCYPFTHPDWLQVLGRLFGLDPAPAQESRVLELGCASGINLLPMAEQLPASRFVGVDRSPAQIEAGRALIAELGLANVTLEQRDILELEPEALGSFDYVICHGVFSWVPRPVQDRIVALLPALLRPQGLAFVSYNVYPGWHVREMVRRMMVFHVRDLDDPRAQLQQARALVDFVAGSVAALREHSGQDKPDPHALLLAQELELVQRMPDAYLFHEHLEHDNEPLYFHEFMTRLEGQPLRYLCDTDLGMMVGRDLPPQVAETLDRVARDQQSMEQYLDFVRNRHFRTSVLCRGDHEPRRKLHTEVTRRLRWAMQGQPEHPGDAQTLREGVALGFTPKERPPISAGDALTKAALLELCDHWPASLAFDDLEAAARVRLGRLGLAAPSEAAEQLAANLIECLLRAAVTARCHEPPLAGPGPRPAVSRFNRLAATRWGWIAGGQHRPFILEPSLIQLLPLLDGRDRPALLAALRERVAAGDLTPRKDGAAITDPALLDAALTGFIEQSLTTLASLPVLVAS